MLRIKHISLFILFLISACSSSKQQTTAVEPDSVFVDIQAEVLSVFQESDYLALVKINQVNCKFEICEGLQVGDETLLHFVMTHKPTSVNPRFKALAQHYPGLSNGNQLKLRLHIRRNHSTAPKVMAVHHYEIIP